MSTQAKPPLGRARRVQNLSETDRQLEERLGGRESLQELDAKVAKRPAEAQKIKQRVEQKPQDDNLTVLFVLSPEDSPASSAPAK